MLFSLMAGRRKVFCTVCTFAPFLLFSPYLSWLFDRSIYGGINSSLLFLGSLMREEKIEIRFFGG